MKRLLFQPAGLIRPGRRTAAALIALVMTAALSAACSNAPPVASVSEDVTVFVGYSLRLDGSGSADPDGDELTYVWRLEERPDDSQATLTSQSTANPRFKPDMQGKYVISLEVGDGEMSSPSVRMTLVAKPWFTEVTLEAGVPGGGSQDFFDGTGPGAAWGDYDGDGDPDLYVTADGPNILYRNDGDGTFTEVTVEAGVEAPCNSYGAAWGDFDSDDDLDLYVVCHSEDQHSLNHKASEPNILYRNNGDGTFTDLASEAGVDYVAHAAGASWVDYDNDGHLDLYVANWGIADFQTMRAWTEANTLFRNNGDGTFENVTERAGVAGRVGPFDMDRALETELSGLTFMGLWSDFDNDGDPDLLECSEQGASILFRNDGDGTFTDVTKAAGLFLRGSCMGVDSGDYDRDGFLDIFWTNYRENYLWKGGGEGFYLEAAKEAGVADALVGWGAEFVDFDNDGLLDLYVVNGLVGASKEETGAEWGQPRGQPNILYRNNGDGTFTDVTAMAGFGDPGVGRGAAVADYDNDGDLDFYVVNADGQNILYRNEIGNRNNWIKLRFQGTSSNRGGVGVRVRLDTQDWSQIAEVKSGSGYLAGNQPGLFFGLGQLDRVKGITVIWPSGISQSLNDVAVNQTITIAEGP